MTALSLFVASTTASVFVGGRAPSVEEGITFPALPDSLRGGVLKVLHDLHAEEVVRLECPGATKGSCMVYVMHHHCTPCTNAVNGGLPALLSLKGFAPQLGCAPQFLTKATGSTLHPTALYKKEMLPGTSVSMRLSSTLRHAAVVTTERPLRSCEVQDHPSLCSRQTDCKWNANTQTCHDAECGAGLSQAPAQCLRECQLLGA